MADTRKMEKTSTPGIYRLHRNGCPQKRCKCPYLVRWRVKGSFYKRTFPTLDLAREFKGSLSSGTGSKRPASRDTVGDYFAEWLPAYRGRTARGLEERTRSEYEISGRLHILPLPVAKIRLRDLGAPDIRDWFAALERKGASPQTIRRAKAALSVMLASAMEDGDLTHNPAAGVRYVPSAKAKAAHKPITRRKLTLDDVEAILKATDEGWRPFFLLATESGLRVGELLGLTWQNIHLGDDPHIMVTEQIYRGQRKKLKTDSSVGRVPLSAGMASALASLRPEKAPQTAPVFPSKVGTPMTYANVRSRVLLPALKRAGLDGQGIGFHAFRKACGSLLLDRGKTLPQVQGWLRHSQLQTTLKSYVHRVDDGLGSADLWDGV